VNNILACLGKMLRYAHEVELLEVVPRVKLLKIPPQKFDFLTFEELSRLTDAVRSDPERWALVLLGADAGLRQGEIIALEWGDVDLVAGALTVRRSSWKGIVGTPKSGRDRKVPLTVRLKAALKAHRHLKSELVFCHADGKPFTQSAIEAALRFGCKRAGLRSIGSHVLRHTFCSHLAMRGAAPKAPLGLRSARCRRWRLKRVFVHRSIRNLKLGSSSRLANIALASRTRRLGFGPFSNRVSSACNSALRCRWQAASS